MDPVPIKSFLTGLAVAGVVTFGWNADAGENLVKFPDNFANGVLYATVERGSLKEEILTSRTSLDAVKAGQPIPSGTVIMLADYRDGRLFRYVVMEERTGWGTEYPPKKH